MTTKSFLLAFIALPFISSAQTSFTVKGKVGAANAPAKAYLEYYVADKSIRDSAVLVNGTFEFKGTITNPVQGYFFINQKGDGIHAPYDYTSLYIDKGTTLISSPDSAKHATISGTKLADEDAAYKAALKPVNAAYEALEAKNNLVSADVKATDAYKKQEGAEEKAIEKQENAITRKFIQEHPSSIMSLNALRSYTYSADYADVEPLFHNLSPEVQASVGGKAYADQLEKLKTVAYGKTAPEFAMADTSGKMVALSSLRGKYVLVDFWASWCGPCRAENPNVVKAYNKYKDRNFTILSVSLDREGAKDKWLAAIHKDGLTWTHVSDLKFWKNEAAELYGVKAIPQNFLLDPNGKIIGKNLRGEDLENKLAEVLPSGRKNTKAE